MQAGVSPVLRGYSIDPIARIDLRALRDQWLNHVLKGGPKPALLKDKVNYQVMGTNEWKHAPSLPAMSNGRLRLYLSARRSANTYRLSEAPGDRERFVTHVVDFSDRSDADVELPESLIRRAVSTPQSIVFWGDPLPGSVEVSGLISGQLDFVTNKKDLDFKVALFELLPNGDYFQLSYAMGRASHAQDRSRRKLLIPGRRQQLMFDSLRITSRRFQAGSRICIALSINKQPDRQINYGTGKDVSEESIKDAASALEVQWYATSYVDLPTWR
jgi:putative CocE/NonD family hydrolase